MKLDTMIDIETLATDGPRPLVAQIGAVLFNAVSGTVETERCWSIEIAEDQTSDIDVRTILFWLRQPRETVESVFFSGGRVPLLSALLELKQAFIDKSERVWARSTNFDLAILSRAYDDMSIGTLIPHWKWREERVMRDLLEQVGAMPTRTGLAHNALDDARYQAEVVITATRLFTETVPPEFARAS